MSSYHVWDSMGHYLGTVEAPKVKDAIEKAKSVHGGIPMVQREDKFIMQHFAGVEPSEPWQVEIVNKRLHSQRLAYVPTSTVEMNY